MKKYLLLAVAVGLTLALVPAAVCGAGESRAAPVS